MTTAAPAIVALSSWDWLQLFLYYLSLSLLAVGGAISTAPDMHRFLVERNAWLTDPQFNASIAIAQAAPGPNVLFVAVIGFNVGGLVGMLATLLGTLLPSTVLALIVARLGQAMRQHRGAIAFTAGLAPLTMGLLLSTGWILLDPVRSRPAAWLLVVLTLLVMLRTKANPLWLIALGALAGAAGWV